MINTVTGKINISDLGSVLCHEHIICCNTSMRNAFGENYFSTKAVTEKAISMLKDFQDREYITSLANILTARTY